MTTALEKITMDGFQALIFKVQDIPFAVDLEQVDELLELDQLEPNSEKPIRFDRLVSFGPNPVIFKDPRILTFHFGGNRILVQIDQPEDIVFIRLETMKPFPELLNRVRENSFIWGVGLVGETPVLLIDCQKIAITHQNLEKFVGRAFQNSETHAKT